MSGRDRSGRFLARQPSPVFLLGESQGQRSLAGHSLLGHKESDMIEAIEHTCTQITLESILLYLRASETANLSKLRFVGLAVFKTVLSPQTIVFLKLPWKIFRKLRSWHCSHHFTANRWGNNGNSVTLFWGALKPLQMVTAAMKLKDACSLKEKL